MSEWDEDIANMPLTEVEKNGLQVYRNYGRAFNEHAETQLSKQIDAEQFSLTDLERILNLIAHEDPRFIPVIACAYADEQLKLAFNLEIGDRLLGKRTDLYGPFGPLSGLFRRLQFALAFDLLSEDLIRDFDRLRSVRNKLSHTWDLSSLKDFFIEKPINEIFAIDIHIFDRSDWFPTPTLLNDLQKLRLRIIWLITRLAYEAPLFGRAKRERLLPDKVLYGRHHPKRLISMAELAMLASRKVVYSA